MGNIQTVFNAPDPKKRIKDMKAGEVGYTVPWAVDHPDGKKPTPENATLNENFTVEIAPGGTVQLKVKCVSRGFYEVEYLQEGS